MLIIDWLNAKLLRVCVCVCALRARFWFYCFANIWRILLDIGGWFISGQRNPIHLILPPFLSLILSHIPILPSWFSWHPPKLEVIDRIQLTYQPISLWETGAKVGGKSTGSQREHLKFTQSTLVVTIECGSLEVYTSSTLLLLFTLKGAEQVS